MELITGTRTEGLTGLTWGAPASAEDRMTGPDRTGILTNLGPGSTDGRALPFELGLEIEMEPTAFGEEDDEATGMAEAPV